MKVLFLQFQGAYLYRITVDCSSRLDMKTQYSLVVPPWGIAKIGFRILIKFMHSLGAMAYGCNKLLCPTWAVYMHDLALPSLFLVPINEKNSLGDLECQFEIPLSVFGIQLLVVEGMGTKLMDQGAKSHSVRPGRREIRYIHMLKKKNLISC